MKFLLYLLLPISLLSWSFTDNDYKSLTSKQLEIIEMSYNIGQLYGLNYRLAAIAIVESRAGKLNKDNHICGAHQINSILAKIDCVSLNNNPYVSTMASKNNLQSWKYVKDEKGNILRERTLDERTRKYNVGYLNDPHQWVYLKRIHKVEEVLKNHL